jgi:hypothetical protein
LELTTNCPVSVFTTPRVILSGARPEDQSAANALGYHLSGRPSRRAAHGTSTHFGIKEIFDAEPASDIGCVTVIWSGAILKRFGELRAQAEHALAGQQQIERVGGSIVSADRGARLDRSDDQAVVDRLDSTMWAAFAKAASTDDLSPR